MNQFMFILQIQFILVLKFFITQFIYIHLYIFIFISIYKKKLVSTCYHTGKKKHWDIYNKLNNLTHETVSSQSLTTKSWCNPL